jgi:cell division septal protein FtsQ
MGGVVIAAATIILYTPWLPLFDLREIVVRKNSYIPAEEIERVTGFKTGENLFRLHVRRAHGALARLPWAKDVLIHRALLHRVEIVVEERQPVAVIAGPSGAGLLVLGEGGVVVAKATKELQPPLLVKGAPLTGNEPGARVSDPNVVATLERLYWHGLTEKFFQSVDFSNRFSVILQGEKDLVVYLGSVDEIAPRIDALAALLLEIDAAQYRSIDLRFGGEAILVPRKVVNR